MKAKFEKDIAKLSAEKNEILVKYDNHIQRMSKQIYQLNEDKLELQKENEIVKTKMRFIENNSLTTNPRISCMLQQPQSMGSTNLRMDDEEGEVFNNTYLTDLKTGGGFPSMGRDSMR